MRLTEGLDSGPICAQADEPIRPTDTYGTVSERLRDRGGELLISVLDDRPPCREQDESLATYADKLTAADRLLDPDRPADELERVVRALSPHVGAAVVLDDGSRLGVWEAQASTTPGPPRATVSFDGPVPVLGCADGSLELAVVQPPGRRSMAGADYLRGRRS
jgi:methionyl-tRNA formyltransferase